MGDFPCREVGCGPSYGVVASTGLYRLMHRPQTISWFAVGLELLSYEDAQNLGLFPDFGTSLGL